MALTPVSASRTPALPCFRPFRTSRTSFRVAALLLGPAGALMLASLAPLARAQAPVPFPYTATTVAGGAATSTGTASAPVACAAGSPYKSYDSYGNGCPGLNVNFATDTRGGLASDGQGNIFISDTANNMIRKYDPRTGVVSRLVGKGTNCTTANGLQDSSGDGCPATQTSLVSTPRGTGSDPYGNVLFAGYGTQMVHIICQSASPLCPNTTNHKQVGFMYRVAGCVASQGMTATAGSGTTAGSEGDGTLASPFENLSGDIADWGTGNVVGSAATQTCSGSVGEVNQPRGVGADRFGNVYIGETALGRWRVVLGPLTSTYFSGNNPLYAIIQQNPAYPSPAYGRIYPLINGFAVQTSGGITYNIPTAAGGACQTGTGASTAKATDAFGDGCQYFATAPSTNTSSVQGIIADSFGNIIFSDAPNSLLRVIYAGGASAAANGLYTALVNNGVAAPQAGFVYVLAGGGATSTFATPTLGTTATLSNGIFKLAVGPGGNLYLGDTNGTAAQLYDVSTGYIRTLFKSGTPCAAHVNGSSNGDGCPVGGFSFSTSNGFGVAPDPLGNLYFLDQNALLRKAEAVSLVPTTVGSTTAAGAAFTQTLQFHGPAGTASMTASVGNNAPDITVGTITCGSLNADTTLDCTVPVTFAPAQPGPRTLNLAVTASNAGGTVLGSQVFAISGNGNGTALVADVAAPSKATITASGVAPVGVAVGNTGSLYTADTAAQRLLKITGGTSSNIGSVSSSASQIAVDPAGNVYVVSVSSASITRYTLGAGGAYTSATLSLPAAITTPQAIVFDASGNAFIADKSTGSVFEVPAGSTFSSVQPSVVVAAGFTNPVGLSIDGVGNLFVADSSAPGVFKIANINGVLTTSVYASASSLNVTATPGATAASSSPAITVAGLVPVSVAADPGGNVYVQDSASKKVLLLPVATTSAASVTVLSGLSTPSGVGVDGNGVVYSADSAAKALVQVNRNAASYAFASTSGTANAVSGYFGNAGNLSTTGFAETTSSEFLFDSTGTSTCGTIPSASNALLPGGDCLFTAYFNPATSGNAVTSRTTFLPASSTTGVFTLTGTEPSGTTFNTTVNISAPTPAAPVYTGTGTTASFTVSVSATGTADVPTGSITITTSCTTGGGAYPLTNGSVTVNLSGCTAGAQTVAAAYANTPDSSTPGASFGASTNSAGFNVAQAATTITWAPATTSRPYSAALGSGVLNAAAMAGSTTVPGFYLYTATASGGTTAKTVHAASFLPVGAYSLGVTFVPTDSTDYAGSMATIASFTVTKATTTAGLGATQMLVAADGTGNYSKVQDAVNAIPAAGGTSVYIKPGTYTGDVTVVQPNVALRGLGGDPTAVILTHSGGAFGGSGVYQYAGEFNTSQANGYQLPTGSSLFSGDEGSATLVVAKGINTASGVGSTATLIPNGFYGEYFTLANTYDSDNTTTTTTYLPAANSGTCTANQGPARTYYDLFNASLLCASQALAIWTTSDLSVMNNVYTTSLQDTIYAGSQGSGSNGYVPARQYWFRGKVTGTVDYIFGDAAAVFDFSSIYTVPHGYVTGTTNLNIAGTATIEAQNKMTQTGSSGDYLSGYVMNSNVFTSLVSGQTGLEFGRPYGPYSTWIMLNSYVDQVAPAGYIEFSNSTSNLPTSTYTEFNDIPYTDPATGSPDLNGVTYLGQGGSSGAGVTGTRETTSQNPGTVMAANVPRTSMTAAQATLYYPAAFLGNTVPSTVSSTANWNPIAALATNTNAFTGSATSSTVAGGTSVTILMRPQTPGLGAVTNGAYTIPTGTYSLSDTVNGATATLASGSLDASGEATFTSSSLVAGTHTLTWTYGGDTNFSGSTASSYTLTVTGATTTTSVSTTAANNTITYGQSAPVTVTVASASGTPTGSVTLTIDGTTTQTAALSGGTANFSVSSLLAGSHTFAASYGGATTFTGSTSSSSLAITVAKAPLTIVASCSNRVFDQPNVCTASASGYQYSDTASTVIASGPAAVTTAVRTSPANPAYAVTGTAALTAFGTANYTISNTATTFAVSGNAPQTVLFPQLPPLPQGGSYQLTARTTSGLPVTYTVTAGNAFASVNGSTLTITGAGTITVTATSVTDATGDYAQASASSTFTAQ